MSISLRKILSKKVLPNVWALMAQVRAYFMAILHHDYAEGLETHVDWQIDATPWGEQVETMSLATNSVRTVCNVIHLPCHTGEPLRLMYGEGGWLRHNMEMEERAVVHAVAAFQSDGRGSGASCSYLLACTHRTVSKEHLFLRNARAQKKPKAELQGVRGFREQHIPLQNSILMLSALREILQWYYLRL